MTGKTHGDSEPFSVMGVLQQPIASGGPSPAPAPAALVPPLIDMDKINPPAVRSVHEVGANVACLAKFSGVYHHGEVIERKETPEGMSYYVHYKEYNKRLDEWVSTDRVEPWTETLAPPQAGQKLPLPVGAGTPTSGGGAEGKGEPESGRVTRNLKRRYDEIHHVQKGVDELAPIDATLEKEHDERTKVKNVQVIEMGRYEVDTWYYSPYPDPYAAESKLLICEFCLKYMRKKKAMEKHKEKCEVRRPPGDEIFSTTQSMPEKGPKERDQSEGATSASRSKGDHTLAMFEVDGRKAKVYCQNLCLLAKLFLDHKTLYYDVDPFLFYVLTECHLEEHRIVGYFSKEKRSLEEHNLACILTLPPHQRKGYGRFLIAFSYELSKKEGKVGTPERPLSDLGQVSFRSYWTRVLLETLREHKGNLSVKDISHLTAIRTDDIVTTLQSLSLIKYWKGQHIIHVAPKIIEDHLKVVGSQPQWTIRQSDINWTPAISPKDGKKGRTVF